MRYKIVMNYSDGTSEEDDEVFDTAAEAAAYGAVQVENFDAGGEVLHLSNPGDYPLSDVEADFEVIEVEG